MNNQYLLPVLLAIFLFACKNKTETIEKSKAGSQILPVIETQSYETALADLKLNKDSLLLKKIKNYTATQTFEKKQRPKMYFHSYEKINGKLAYCELTGRDTIISERVSNNSIEKIWHQINRKVLITSIGSTQQGNSYIIEKEKNKTDTTKYVSDKGRLSFIQFPNNAKETFYYSNSAMQVIYTNNKNDTLYQYNVLDDGEKVNKRIYTKGMHHQYQFIYNDKKMLTKIIWKENNTKVNATAEFVYDTNGLPIKRIIQSDIPAFGNSVTVYKYTAY